MTTSAEPSGTVAALRTVLDARDDGRLAELIAADPGLVNRPMLGMDIHPLGPHPLTYLALLPYDCERDVWRRVTGTAPLARRLIAAGARVDGDPGESETPLITAASYGDAELARALLEAGADLQARSTPEAGGVPSGTALLHAAVFGMTAVVDVLVAAGARPGGLSEAAASGDLSGWLDADPDPGNRVRGLCMAAAHGRLAVIDELVAAGTPVDAVDDRYGRLALVVAAGRPESVRRLLAHGADPAARDGRGDTALEVCRRERPTHPDTPGWAEVEALLTPFPAG